MLNEEQQEAKRLIENYIKNPIGTFGLLGAGGTGKTYLVTSLSDSEDFLYLAPTNKAVNVLRKGLVKNGALKTNVKTVDSFLGFKKIMDEENKPRLTYKIPNEDKIPNVIVVDEVSMLRDKHVELLLKITQNKALIFLGDDKQIPPVITDDDVENEVIRDSKGFRISKAFTVLEKFYTLTKQNRQNQESSLFKLINGFRNNMQFDLKYDKIALSHNNGNDVLFLNENDDELIKIIKGKNVVAVTFKNGTSDLFNYKIGRIKTNNYQYNIKKINEGDDVVFFKYYRNDDTSFYASEQIKIVKIYEDDIKIKIPYYSNEIIHKTKLANCHSENGFVKQIWLKNELLRRKVYDIVWRKRNEFKQDLIKGDFTAKDKLIKLNTFYSDFKNGFADLKKPYSMTSHKSQGSTYDYVIIPIYDYFLKHHQDRNQLFYVAISRASKGVIFVNTFCNFTKNTSRKNFTQEERYLIAGMQDFKCKCCNLELKDGRFDIDHITALNKGGTNEIDNLQALCRECHKQKTKTDKL